MQYGHAIGYQSRKLNDHETHYVTRDLELVAIVYAINMWRHYILGRNFVLIADHNGMKYLFGHPKLNSIQAIWMALINEFDFEI
jgi:hypothetical protein